MAEVQSLVWKGDAVTERMRKAQIAGINRVMSQCVGEAKANHPWQNQTGILEGGIDVVDYAASTVDGAKGTWGVQDVRYALAQELGATIVPVKAKALAIPRPGGGVSFVQKVVLPARPYLRPAGDAKYPNLPLAIRAAYDKSGGSDG